MRSFALAPLRRGDRVLLALAAVNVAWVGANAGAFVTRLYLDADIASAPVIGSLVASAPAGRIVTLGNYPWYEPLWFMELSRWLPWHRLVWEAAPFVVSLIDLALLVVVARLAVGGRAALFTGAVFCCTTRGTRFVLLTPNAHGAALLHGLLLGAALVIAVRNNARITRPVLFGAAAVLAFVSGLGATDRLFVVDSLVPFVVAACFGWWRTRCSPECRLALAAIGTAAVALLLGEIVRHLMQHEHVVPTPGFVVSLAPPSRLASNASTLVRAFSYLGGGDVLASPFRMASLPAFAAGLLTLAAGALVARWSWLGLRRGWARVEVGQEPDLTRETYLVFWGATLVCSTIAFILSSASIDAGDSRYLLAAFVAVLALLPVLVQRSSQRTQLGLAIAACAFALLSLHAAVGEGRYAYGSKLTPTEIRRFVRYASRHKLRYGYADYATAPALTWATGVRVQVFPVQPCGARLCPFYLHTISSWYSPGPDARTFLIVDRATQGSYRSVTEPSSAFGRALERVRIGDLTVYVYDHDLAAALG